MQYEKLFRTQSVWKSIFSLAIPSVIIILVMILYNMTDMFFVGQLGDYNQVAAVSVVSPIFSLATAVATMLGSGGCALIARALGSDDTKQAKVYASLCGWGSIGFGLLITAALLLARKAILPALGANEDIISYAEAYMSICALGVPFMLASTTLGTIIRAEGAVKEGMIGNMAATLVNMILDPLFILVMGMGVAGAAVATVIGNLVGTLYYVYFMRKKAAVLNMSFHLAGKNFRMLFSILALGMPNALSSILSGFASTFSNRLLGNYGTDAIAAMAAAGKTTMLIAMIQMGICMGIQPLLAYNYGAKDIQRLKEVIRKVSILTIGVGMVTGGLCYICRHQIIGMFIKNVSVARLGEELVLFLVAASPVIGLYYLSTNFVQASGNALSATVMSLLRQGALLIPLLYLLHEFMGMSGIAAAHMAADLLSVVIGIFLLFRQYSRLVRETENE
ncbi:MAG: MATE family efflux transporter [Ruminococcus sp.]|nr:MATE family efflux transporter [Ruminococcus sp.]